MKTFLLLLLLSGMAWGQQSTTELADMLARDMRDTEKVWLSGDEIKISHYTPWMSWREFWNAWGEYYNGSCVVRVNDVTSPTGKRWTYRRPELRRFVAAIRKRQARKLLTWLQRAELDGVDFDNFIERKRK